MASLASNDLGGQNEYAYDTITAILYGVFEIKFFDKINGLAVKRVHTCLLYTSPSPRDGLLSRMPSSA